MLPCRVAQRDGDAGQHEDLLEPVVEPHDRQVAAQRRPARQRGDGRTARQARSSSSVDSCPRKCRSCWKSLTDRGSHCRRRVAATSRSTRIARRPRPPPARRRRHGRRRTRLRRDGRRGRPTPRGCRCGFGLNAPTRASCADTTVPKRSAIPSASSLRCAGIVRHDTQLQAGSGHRVERVDKPVAGARRPRDREEWSPSIDRPTRRQQLRRRPTASPRCRPGPRTTSPSNASPRSDSWARR